MSSRRSEAVPRQVSRIVVKSRIPRIANELKPAVDLAVRQTSGLIAREAKQRVPVRTGSLRNAIDVERKGMAKYEVVAWSDEAWYGHLVEWGTRHSAPRPFLTPAAESAREPLEHRVRQALGRL
jgi:HK97 gp10 family phage protein